MAKITKIVIGGTPYDVKDADLTEKVTALLAGSLAADGTIKAQGDPEANTDYWVPTVADRKRLDAVQGNIIRYKGNLEVTTNVADALDDIDDPEVGDMYTVANAEGADNDVLIEYVCVKGATEATPSTVTVNGVDYEVVSGTVTIGGIDYTVTDGKITVDGTDYTITPGTEAANAQWEVLGKLTAAIDISWKNEKVNGASVAANVQKITVTPVDDQDPTGDQKLVISPLSFTNADITKDVVEIDGTQYDVVNDKITINDTEYLISNDQVDVDGTTYNVETVTVHAAGDLY